MSKFRRKEIVEAFHWTGKPDQEADPDWIVRAMDRGEMILIRREDGRHLVVVMGDGPYGVPDNTIIGVGMWIVKEGDKIRGYHPFDFKELFEAVE